jgi:paraquat-inducible protein A
MSVIEEQNPTMKYSETFNLHRLDKTLWLTSFGLFGLGISLPMFTMEKFFVFKDSFSLLSGLYQLLTNGESFLFLLLFLFSVAMPLCKFYFSFRIAFGRLGTAELKLKRIKQLSIVGKWSMADVFVIAVLASTVKVGGLAEVHIHIITASCNMI